MREVLLAYKKEKRKKKSLLTSWNTVNIKPDRKGMSSCQPAMSAHGFKSASAHAGLVDSSGFWLCFLSRKCISWSQKGPLKQVLFFGFFSLSHNKKKTEPKVYLFSVVAHLYRAEFFNSIQS